MNVFKIGQMLLYYWATFVRKFVTKKLKKSPNLDTLLPSKQGREGVK